MDAQTTAVEQNLEPEKASRRSPLRKRGVRLMLLVVLVGFVALGLAWFAHYQRVGKYLEDTDDAYIQADAVVVSPKIAGYVEQVFVSDNQAVKPGDPLVRIDPRDYHAQAAQAQAQIDIAQANARGVRAQIAEQGAAVQQALQSPCPLGASPWATPRPCCGAAPMSALPSGNWPPRRTGSE